MNLARSFQSDSEYHVSGELIDTDMNFILPVLAAVFGEKHVRLKSHHDAYAETNCVSINIYRYSGTGESSQHYLLGGSVFCGREFAEDFVRALARDLETRDIVYSLELTNVLSPGETLFSINHPRF